MREIREILFRGKCCTTGEWVEGFLGIEELDDYVIQQFSFDEYFASECIDQYSVKLETVGRYTGLTDKNGTRIFEGDVVKLFDIAIGEIVCEYGAFGINCRQQIDYDYLASEIASVTGCDNTPMFCRNDNFVSLWELYWNYNQESSEISVIEVIGNIHDNPELLKGSAKNE